MALTIGTQLGSHEIIALLGKGGMGEVYRARDLKLKREVAIKILPEEFSRDAHRVNRFQREAEVLASLNHPNIAAIHDFEETNGTRYLVLELVEGVTLADRIAQGSIQSEDALMIARQICDALEAAHEKGMVHRDLKPANVKITPDGKVKVLDFGLAKRMPAGASEMQSAATLDISIPGQMLGTFAYMSPEQIQGQEVDQRSDLFAFGIILYEMLAGTHPWRHVSSVDTLHAILHDDPAMEAIPQQMASVVRKLLRKNPAERFFSAEAVREALAASSVGRGSSAVGRQEAEPLPSVAVLPFLFLSEVEDRQALSLGFADALITTLGSLEDIAVLPTAAIVNCAFGIDPARSCRELGVRHILQGSVQKQGDHWRVSTQLFDSRTQKIAYSEKHDFVMENVFEVQDEIGRKVVESLQSRLPKTVRKSRERYSSDPEAYAEFMAGLHGSYGYSREDLHSAAQHLSRAVALDPKFALAHAWLSHVAMQIYLAIDAQRSWAEKAEYHYQHALELDPDLPEAHWARAAILWSPAKSFQEAEAIAALERVLEARPNFDRAHNRMAGICMHIGRFEEAQTAAEHARRSNPSNRGSNHAVPSFFRYVMAFLCLYRGDFAAAREAGEALFTEAPGLTNSLFCSVHSLLLIGDLGAAADRLRFALERYPDEPLYISLQGMLHARQNQADAAMECVRKALDFPFSLAHAHHTFHHLACIYAVLGDIEKAMAWLEKSVDSGFPCWPFFQVDPSLGNLRGEPRFQRLMEDLERKYTALKISRT
jgi:serine/threonine protein kinase